MTVAEKLAKAFPNDRLIPARVMGLSDGDLSLIEFADDKLTKYLAGVQAALESLKALQAKALDSIKLIEQNTTGLNALDRQQLINLDYLNGVPELKAHERVGKVKTLHAPIILLVDGAKILVAMDVPSFVPRLFGSYLSARALAGTHDQLVPDDIASNTGWKEWAERLGAVSDEDNLANWRSFFGGVSSLTVIIRSRRVIREQGDSASDYVAIPAR